MPGITASQFGSARKDPPRQRTANTSPGGCHKPLLACRTCARQRPSDSANFHAVALGSESTGWLRAGHRELSCRGFKSGEYMLVAGVLLALQPGARPTSRGAGRQAARLSLMLSSAGGASLTRPPIAIILPSDTDRSESCPTCRAPNDTVLWCSRSSVDTV